MYDYQLNLGMIREAATKLGELSRDFVFVGGSTIALYVDSDSVILSDIRPTTDVDVVTEISSHLEQHELEKKLMKRNFSQAFNRSDDPICRWRNGELIVDVMPLDERILGFSNRWYREGFSVKERRQIEEIEVFIMPAPLILCTKIDAKKSRGDSNWLFCKDTGDIASIVVGRKSLTDEIRKSGANIVEYLQNELVPIMKTEQFDDVIASLIPQDKLYKTRLLSAVDLKNKLVESISQ
ncbi:MAG: hypothetical protein EOP04_04385 [Proteobacteria bacterium]|nr:MAG: hypothetical protein EOP04_04385 [Pseudomonadota bacterium]